MKNPLARQQKAKTLRAKVILSDDDAPEIMAYNIFVLTNVCLSGSNDVVT